MPGIAGYPTPERPGRAIGATAGIRTMVGRAFSLSPGSRLPRWSGRAPKGTTTMLTSLPEPPRPRPRLTELAEPVDGHPYRSGAEAVTADGRSLPLVSATLRGTARGGIARLVLE